MYLYNQNFAVFTCSINKSVSSGQSVSLSVSQISYFSKKFSKCSPCMAVVSKMFPDRNLLYILQFMELITTRSLSESTYDPSDPSLILPSYKNGILI